MRGRLTVSVVLLFAWLGVLLVASSACSPIGATQCTTRIDCPQGQACEAGRCVVTDAGDDVADTTPVDAAGDGDDTGGTDDGGDDVGLDGSDVTLPSRNGCGGVRALRLDGANVEPGDACGVFGEGVVACASLETVTCRGAATTNACGGAGVLPVELGAPCGVCDDGVWTCGDGGGVVCVGAAEPNGCGGCGALPGRPGARCDAREGEGTWICATADDLACVEGDVNLCGGDSALLWQSRAARPGDVCDTGCGEGDGVLICAGGDGLSCRPTAQSTPANACGGCGPLPGVSGEACGACGGGAWQCNVGTGGTMACVGASPVNACGGCGDETNRPGDPCGERREWLCDGPALVCVSPIDPSTANPCGGTSELAGTPGDACGPCGRGRLVCETQNRLTCAGDAPGNVCGGCDVVGGRESDACGVCGTGRLTCDGLRLLCVGDAGPLARNACGGCGELDDAPGDECGDCLAWTCTRSGGLRCELDPEADTCDEPITCDNLDCERENRRCEAGDRTRDATCGPCFDGYSDVGGACVRDSLPVRSCEEAGCAAQNRECLQPDDMTDAVCGDCLDGFEDDGRDCVSPILPPTGVAASDGASSAHVTVTWNAVVGASAYYVYRDGVRITSTQVTGTTYEDADAPAPGAPGRVFSVAATTNRPNDVQVTWNAAGSPVGAAARYQVRAVVDGRTSDLSAEDSGFRAGERITGYEVQVGTGTWRSVGSATSWNDTEAPAGSLTLGTPSATTTNSARVELTIDAPTITNGPTRTYRVRAVSAAGTGTASDSASGNRSVGSVSWQWQWSSTSTGTFANLSGATSRTAFDTGAQVGVPRWYRVLATAAGVSSAVSTSVEGLRPPATSLGQPCTNNNACATNEWCTTETTNRRCAPFPIVGSIPIAFQWIPGGTFTMGSPTTELGRNTNEGQVSVTLSRDVFVSRTPITQGQWRAVMMAWNGRPANSRVMSGWATATPTFGTEPACFRTASGTTCTNAGTGGINSSSPVERVSWWDAVVFANALSLIEGLTPCYTLQNCSSGSGRGQVGGGCDATDTFCSTGNFSCESVTQLHATCTGYRLLTEAEWERMARAGSVTATYAGDLSGSNCADVASVLDPIAWYTCTSGSRTQAVQGKAPNDWGIHDALGSVNEWTWNWSATTHSGGIDPLGPTSAVGRVLRGGAWNSSSESVRAAYRFNDAPPNRSRMFGFRIARNTP